MLDYDILKSVEGSAEEIYESVCLIIAEFRKAKERITYESSFDGEPLEHGIKGTFNAVIPGAVTFL